MSVLAGASVTHVGYEPSMGRWPRTLASPHLPSYGHGSQCMPVCFVFFFFSVSTQDLSPYVAQAGLEVTNIHKLLDA